MPQGIRAFGVPEAPLVGGRQGLLVLVSNVEADFRD